MPSIPAEAMLQLLLRLHEEARGVVAVRLIRREDIFGIAVPADAGDLLAVAIFDAISQTLAQCANRLCLTCSRKAKKPSVIVLVHAERPDAQHCIAMAICRSCGSRSNEDLKPAVIGILRQVWPDLRALSGNIGPAGQA